MIDIVGRIPLLIASTVSMSLALAGFGSYAYYNSMSQHGFDDSTSMGQHDLIPLTCVLVFTTALALGISPISWLLIGELFPLEYRGLGSSISTSFSYFCAFFGIKLFMDFQQVRIKIPFVFSLITSPNQLTNVLFLMFTGSWSSWGILVLCSSSSMWFMFRSLLCTRNKRQTARRNESWLCINTVVQGLPHWRAIKLRKNQ